MRAKFYCSTSTKQGEGKMVELMTEYSESKEDNQFSVATPYGEIKMLIDNPNAMDFLKPGKSYYVDFTEVKANND